MFDVKAQSKAAYDQHKDMWQKHAKEHAKFKHKDFSYLRNTGIGRAMLLVATGYSLELNIEAIRENQKYCDIMCCDKSLGILLDHGITPQFVFIADAKVDFNKYCKKWSEDPRIKEITAIMNVCANPEWSHKVTWKDIIFTVNKDAMGYEREFMKLSGCQNVIIAGTNVSNAMLVFATQCEGDQRRNFLGYDKYILVGYDYCWTLEGNYYAYDKDGGGKINYMRHFYILDLFGNSVYTSHNLHNSAQWINAYINTYTIPIVNCSDYSLIGRGTRVDIAEQMKYNLDIEDSVKVQEIDRELVQASAKVEYLKNKLRELAQKHYYGYVATV